MFLSKLARQKRFCLVTQHLIKTMEKEIQRSTCNSKCMHLQDNLGNTVSDYTGNRNSDNTREHKTVIEVKFSNFGCT